MDSEVADDYADALDALWYRQDCDNDDPLYRRFLAFRSRLASAEAELAALKARIAEAAEKWRGDAAFYETAGEGDKWAAYMQCAAEQERLLREDDGRGG